MPNRTAKFVSAIFASVFAGMPLTAIAQGATPAADDCLSGPKVQTPQGSHWYYRIDRATKRHCWYLREERETVSQTAAPNSSPAAKPVPPNAEAAMQRSIADAHAELPSPQTPGAQDTSAAAAPMTSATAADVAGGENSQPANARDANTQLSAIASRWPDQSGASSSSDPGPATSSPDATEPSKSDAAPPATLAAVTLAAADSSSQQTETGSLRMLLLIIIGALSLAGLMGSAIFRFGSMQRIGRRDVRGDRRAIWDSVSTDRLSPPALPNWGERARGVDIPRELAGAHDPNDRITEMLARLARSAKT